MPSSCFLPPSLWTLSIQRRGAGTPGRRELALGWVPVETAATIQRRCRRSSTPRRRNAGHAIQSLLSSTFVDVVCSTPGRRDTANWHSGWVPVETATTVQRRVGVLQRRDAGTPGMPSSCFLPPIFVDVVCLTPGRQARFNAEGPERRATDTPVCFPIETHITRSMPRWRQHRPPGLGDRQAMQCPVTWWKLFQYRKAVRRQKVRARRGWRW